MAVKLTTGIIRGAQKGLIYGVAGIGKSTLAAQLPKPVFIDAEDGTKELDVARYSVSGHAELFEAISLVESSDFKTLVIDSIDWVEKLLARKVCDKGDEKGNKKDRIEDFGYGKGWKYLTEEVEKFLFRLDSVLRKGINVVLLGHSEVVKFQEPERSEAYDRYELKLSKDNSANVREWCGFVLFMNWKTTVVEVDKKTVAVGGKERVIHAQHSAGWDAKNRHGLKDKIKADIKELAPIFGETPKPAFEYDVSALRAEKAAEELTAKSSQFVASEIVGELIEKTMDIDSKVLKSFLINRGELKEDQELESVSDSYAKRAVAAITAFKQSVKDYAKSNPSAK
jgi:hypothetical protein